LLADNHDIADRWLRVGVGFGLHGPDVASRSGRDESFIGEDVLLAIVTKAGGAGDIPDEFANSGMGSDVALWGFQSLCLDEANITVSAGSAIDDRGKSLTSSIFHPCKEAW
jgi:hypothetical protein